MNPYVNKEFEILSTKNTKTFKKRSTPQSYTVRHQTFTQLQPKEYMSTTPHFPIHMTAPYMEPQYHPGELCCYNTQTHNPQRYFTRHNVRTLQRENVACVPVSYCTYLSTKNVSCVYATGATNPACCVRAQTSLSHVNNQQGFRANTISFNAHGRYQSWVRPNTRGIQHVYSRLPQDSQVPNSHRKNRYRRSKFPRFEPTALRGAPDHQLNENQSRKHANVVYEPHWTKEQITEGIENKTLLSGTFRVNPKNCGDSYIKHPLGDADIYIHGLVNRNRALPNDLVAVQVEPKKNWRVFDTYVSNPQASEPPNTPQNRRQKYISLAEFLSRQRCDLEKLIGVSLVEKIAEDLESSEDPPEWSAKNSGLVPWWTVIQRTARVVGIINQLHHRVCFGQLVVPKPASTPKKGDENSCTHSSVPNNGLNVADSNWSFANLTHSDNRIPRLIIPRSACPEAFRRHPESYSATRFVARITDWPESSRLPRGEILRSLTIDSSNLLENETERILVNTGFILGLDNINHFPDAVNESVEVAVRAATSNLTKELTLRKDLRSQCIVTIDPSTARDLDDALHCRILSSTERTELATQGHPDAMYEVGVHIADVSYFVRPDSAVDEEAAKRATTIYLVQLCVPMLPRLLCEELCSLNVGEDKLAFSAIFTVSERGEVLTKWFGRTVIRSCARLSYEDAQYLIDHPQDGWNSDSLPKIEAPHNAKSVLDTILMLHELATHRRKRRFAGGSLRLDAVKLKFALDDDNKHPIGVSPYVPMPSNWLVEEWMLAANEAVAIHLAAHLPQTAFLRRHPPPSLKQLKDVASTLEAVGIKVNTETAGSIQASVCGAAGCPLDTGYQYSSKLAALCAEMSTDLPLSELEVIEQMQSLDLNESSFHHNLSFNSAYKERRDKLENEARLLIIVSLLTKTMNLAEYFCLGEFSDSTSTKHYALNMDYYTHFTSPIRRYADILVHRQLAAVLAHSAAQSGDSQMANWYLETALPPEVESKDLQIQAEVCNSKKLAARLAGEESAELFFTLFVMESGPITEVCAVIGVLDQSFTVLLLSTGLTRRVYLNRLNLKKYEFVPGYRETGSGSRVGKLCLLWNPEEVVSGSSASTDLINTLEDDENSSPSCGCFYTEIKLLDVVRCRVSVKVQESGDSDTKENNNGHFDEGLPKLVVTLVRSTCSKCCTNT